jgi:hypothetical protein
MCKYPVAQPTSPSLIPKFRACFCQSRENISLHWRYTLREKLLIIGQTPLKHIGWVLITSEHTGTWTWMGPFVVHILRLRTRRCRPNVYFSHLGRGKIVQSRRRPRAQWQVSLVLFKCYFPVTLNEVLQKLVDQVEQTTKRTLKDYVDKGDESNGEGDSSLAGEGEGGYIARD